VATDAAAMALVVQGPAVSPVGALRPATSFLSNQARLRHFGERGNWKSGRVQATVYMNNLLRGILNKSLRRAHQKAWLRIRKENTQPSILFV
jgi:hypothetical protein